MSRIVNLTQDFYRNYRKPPEKHYSEIEFQCDQVHSMGISPDAYDKMLRQAMSENVYMPSIQRVMDLYEPPKMEHIEVPCINCNRMGRIYAVQFFFDDLRRMDIASIDQTIKTDGVYRSVCIGRCTCANGNVFAARLPQVQPPKFILDRAISNNWDAVYEADNISKELNARRTGTEYPPKGSEKWDKIVMSILSKNNVEDIPNE